MISGARVRKKNHRKRYHRGRPKGVVEICGLLFLFAFMGPADLASQTRVYGVVAGETVNVRESPSIKSNIIDTLKRGTLISVTATKDSWARINYSKPNETDFKSGWMASNLIRVISGIGGGSDTYTTEYGADFSLSVDSTDLSCREGYEGFDSCEVEVSLSVSSNYNGFDEPTVNISCEATVRAYDSSGWGSSKSDSESTSIFGREGYDSMEINVRVSSYDPIIEVKLRDVSCSIDSVY